MNSPTIGFLDSGVGGIPYFASTRLLLPEARYLYYADTANFPYGEREVEALREIVVSGVARLCELAEPDVVVVACNTASVVALAELRHRFACPFVGVVPAIKPAALRAAGLPIGVLATSRTVEDPYVADLLAEFARENETVLVAAGGLVELIETGLSSLGEKEVRNVLAEPVARLQAAGVGAVVLGCTHFIHVRDTITSMLGPKIAVVDSVDGVARQTVRVANAHSAQATATHDEERRSRPDRNLLYVSDRDRSRATYEYIAHLFDLSLVSSDEQHGLFTPRGDPAPPERTVQRTRSSRPGRYPAP